MVQSVYTVEDVARVLRFPPGTIRRWIRDGRLRAFHIKEKGGYRIAHQDLQDFIDRNTSPLRETAFTGIMSSN